MVLYLFGSKADLFRESLRLIVDPAALVDALTGGSDDDPDIGTRMVRTYLRIWESPDTGPSMVAMLQSATSNSDAHDAFRAFMQNYVLTAVSGVLGGGEQARLRAMLAASQLVGTAVLRYVMKVPPLATLVRRRGGAADRADGDALPDRGRRGARAALTLALYRP